MHGEARHRRRGWWAFVASLGVHALLLLGALSVRQRQVTPVERQNAVELQLWQAHEVAVTPLPVAPVTHRPVDERPNPPVRAREVTPVPQSQASESQGANASDAPAGPQAPAPSGLTGAHDTPRALTLTPRSEAFGWSGEHEAAHGHTLHNSPDELPTHEQQLAEESAHVGGLVTGLMRHDLARDRVAVGAHDPRLALVRTDVRALVAKVPEFIDPNSPREVVKAFQENLMPGLARAGATGAPYVPPSGYRREDEVPTQLQNLADRGVKDALDLQRQYFAAARFRDFGDGKMGTPLEAFVELISDAQGTHVQLLSGTGLVPFDSWVVKQFENASQVLVSDAGVATRATRSRWHVKGSISYRRETSKIDIAKDGWYLALTSLAGLTTGSFDEVTGKADYIDLRYPHYVCSVDLIEAE